MICFDQDFWGSFILLTATLASSLIKWSKAVIWSLQNASFQTQVVTSQVEKLMCLYSRSYTESNWHTFGSRLRFLRQQYENFTCTSSCIAMHCFHLWRELKVTALLFHFLKRGQVRLDCFDKLLWNSPRKRHSKPDKSFLVSFLGWKGRGSEYKTSTWRLWWLCEGGPKGVESALWGMSYLGLSVVFLVSFSGLNASFVSPDFSGNEMNSRDAKADLPLNFNAVKFTFPDKCAVRRQERTETAIS